VTRAFGDLFGFERVERVAPEELMALAGFVPSTSAV
jgi:hypothetical protein